MIKSHILTIEESCPSGWLFFVMSFSSVIQNGAKNLGNIKDVVEILFEPIEDNNMLFIVCAHNSFSNR